MDCGFLSYGIVLWFPCSCLNQMYAPVPLSGSWCTQGRRPCLLCSRGSMKALHRCLNRKPNSSSSLSPFLKSRLAYLSWESRNIFEIIFTLSVILRLLHSAFLTVVTRWVFFVVKDRVLLFTGSSDAPKTNFFTSRSRFCGQMRRRRQRIGFLLGLH